MIDNSLWDALYNQGVAERVHRLGFAGLSASECGRIGKLFSGKGPAQTEKQAGVPEVSEESLSIITLKKEHMRERARTLNLPLHSYSLTGIPAPPPTLWESRRREMRRWYRLVTTDPFAKLWSVELAENYLGDIDLYGIGQGLNRFFFYVGATELRVPEFIAHVLRIWLVKMPWQDWGINILSTPIFIQDGIMLTALQSLGFFELGTSLLGGEYVRILAYKILNS